MTNTTNTSAADGCTILPDGSAFAVGSLSLPQGHWLYAPREYESGADEPKELPSPILTHALRAEVVAAVRYAIRGATMCGKENDFDPDALVQNAVYALCGPYGSAALAAPAQPVAGQSQFARDVNSRRVVELEAQLEAIGAGGVEPLRKRECLHQISEPAQPKFSTRDDAERLKSVARGMSYNDIGEAVWKYTLLEIAMRLETGGYVAPQPAAQALDSVRVFWQQHTQADALSMTMAELHADVEIVIRAARGAAQAAPVDAERLDYLQECGVTVEVLPGRPGWTFRIGGLHGTMHRSVRTAIDAARAIEAEHGIKATNQESNK